MDVFVLLLLVVSFVLLLLAAWGVGGRIGLFPLGMALFVLAVLAPLLQQELG